MGIVAHGAGSPAVNHVHRVGKRPVLEDAAPGVALVTAVTQGVRRGALGRSVERVIASQQQRLHVRPVYAVGARAACLGARIRSVAVAAHDHARFGPAGPEAGHVGIAPVDLHRVVGDRRGVEFQAGVDVRNLPGDPRGGANVDVGMAAVAHLVLKGRRGDRHPGRVGPLDLAEVRGDGLDTA